MKQLLIAITLFSLATSPIKAQIVDQSKVQEARAALSERDIDEDEVKRRTQGTRNRS